MAKAVFYIKDKVQDVGYRAFVMERLLETNLKGGAVNTEDGNVKVLVEGKKEDIIAFVERLKRERPELGENPVLIGPEFDDSLQIPDETRIAHSLEMNQFGKAVVYLDGIDKKLDKGFGNLESRLAGIDEKLGKGFGELGKKLDELPEKLGKRFDELGEKLDELPEKIGKKLDELPEKIAGRLEKKLDELPERIAKAISTTG